MTMEKITVDNFITDDQTDKVYISSLIDTKDGDLDVKTRSKLKACILKYCRDCELLYNTRDVWARDYMPIQLTGKTKKSKAVYLSFTYKPDYLHYYPECTTNWQLHNVHTKKQVANKEHFDFDIVQMPIILDGGNVIKAIVKNKPCIIMCDKVLKENNVNESEFRDWWERWWKDNFDGTEMQLVLLPWEGKDDNPIGHADGMVRYIEDGRVLMTNYLDFDKRYNDNAGLKIKEKLEIAGFKVGVLGYLDKFKEDKLFSLLFRHSWCYINYLQVGKRILLPSLGYDDLDNEAKQQIKDIFDRETNNEYEIKLLSEIDSDIDMVSIVEDMNDKQNSGGALNCLTWTVRTKNIDE